MKFSTEQKERIAVVTSHVEKLDAMHAPELKAEFVMLNKQGINEILLDLSATRYCDSSGLSAVLIGNRLCRDANGSFVLSGLQPSVEKLVQISQLDRVLEITPTATEGFDLLVMSLTEKDLNNEQDNL
jgi:anti-anti-sigma factor